MSDAPTPPPLLDMALDQRPDGAVVVRPKGEIDLLTAPSFAAGMTGAIDGGARLVVVDLDQVSFFGSAGVAGLARAAERADQAGTGFRLVVGASMASRVLEISGLSQVLELRPTVEAALAG
ncbi:STAS domain-containing protein [Actinokineospora sp. NBRC 105648]|uniref:STAS domain-containing protein n=1 Tax=Actinokineospora sp. NBRC 105648 TaxID=3032206 RepID=UPI0024A0B406|nr:STAS domain-containing protein [Actinokineospora sp. NBRC 105648]GLZ38833.1 anti-sigma-F factor antagonist RsfB [Actinokineospora sp. NBRC 105648]